MFGIDDAMANAVIGGIMTGGAQALFSGIANNYAADRDWSRNASMSWDMWNATNAYNHPAAVMQRYREAGLNPNLIYGQMPQVSQPSVVRSQTKPVDFDLNWFLGQQLEGGKLNNDLAAEQIVNARKEGKIKDVAYEQTREQTNLLRTRNELETKRYEDAHELNKAQIRNLDIKRREVDLAASALNYQIQGDQAVRDFIKNGAAKAGVEITDGTAEAIRRMGTSAGELGMTILKSYLEGKVKDSPWYPGSKK